MMTENQNCNQIARLGFLHILVDITFQRILNYFVFNGNAGLNQANASIKLLNFTFLQPFTVMCAIGVCHFYIWPCG